tara:strand:+ start:2042 stop:2947 length:906 start_codon:yes stop_codon:yes gene_type:complete
MAVNNPDGSSVTVNQPPDASGGAPAYTGVKWETEYEVDFAAFFAASGARDWHVAGHTHTQTVDGVDWQAYSDGATALTSRTSQLEIDASGLVFAPLSGSGDFDGSTTTQIRISPLIADAINAGGGPAYDFDSDTICFQAYLTGPTFTANFQNMGLFVGIDAVSQDNWTTLRSIYWSGWGYAGASFRRYLTSYDGVSPPNSPPSPRHPTLYEVIIGPRLAAPLCRLSDWNGSFPEPGAALYASGWDGWETSVVIKDWAGPGPTAGLDNPTAANGRIAISFSASNSPPAFTGTAHNVRFSRLR